MGGAGVWHSSLHFPGLWATVEAGAGDNESHRMRLISDLAPHQQAMCRIFDNMYEWMLNAFNMPFIGYVGEIDGTFSKHVAARRQLALEGLRPGGRVVHIRRAGEGSARHCVPGGAEYAAYATDPEFRKKMDAIHLENLRRGRQSPDHLRFVTFTTRYHRSHWASVDGMERHYERAEIEAKRTADRSTYEIRTKNITRLELQGDGKGFRRCRSMGRR